jgi:hypothetical protein
LCLTGTKPEPPLPDNCFVYPFYALLFPVGIVGVPLYLLLIGIYIYYNVPICGNMSGTRSIDFLREVDMDRLFDELQLFNNNGTKHGSPFNRQLFTNNNNRELISFFIVIFNYRLPYDKLHFGFVIGN